MTNILFSAVLPVFALLAIGFALGRAGVFDQMMAAAINKFVFLISAPALIFGLLAQAPFENFNWLAIGAYLAVDIVMYATGFSVAYFLFKRDAKEALLIGLATAFANHILFVLPIARSLFGESAVMPILAIGIVDIMLIYGATMIILDAASGADGSVSRVLMGFLKNPQVWAIFGGLLIGLLGINLAKGIQVFTNFAGSTAAPCSLFALGIILSREEDQPDLALPLVATGLKLFLFPLLCWVVFFHLLEIRLDWAKPAMIVAASPSAAMPFILALNYGVRTGTVARILLFTMVGSLTTVSFAAGI